MSYVQVGMLFFTWGMGILFFGNSAAAADGCFIGAALCVVATSIEELADKIAAQSKAAPDERAPTSD